MNQEQLNQRFYLNQVNHNELLSLLQFHFGQSSHTALSRLHTFTKSGDEQISLDVNVDKHGRIFDIIPSRDFPDIELEAISSKIKNTLIDNQSIKIGEVVGFAVNGKVDGFFKYKEEFQILTVPDLAPRITYQVGDHPFLLQFKYASCPDFQISLTRAKEKEIRILRMLNLFTKGRIKHVSPFVKSAWVAKIDDDPSKWTSEYLQETYFYKSAIGDGTSFNDLSGLSPIDTGLAANYFTERGGYNEQRNDYLLLPDNLTGLIDAVENLSPDDSVRFSMACAWFYYSSAIWLDSHSAAFVALITAVESLIDKPQACKECGSPAKDSVERCEVCGEPKYKLTKNFKGFLENHVPFIDQVPKEKQLMYEIRSQLAHGLMLFGRDMEPGNWMNARAQEQDELSRGVHFITLVAIYNWLVSRSNTHSLTTLSIAPTKSTNFAKSVTVGPDPS